jgi:hypothetical protein
VPGHDILGGNRSPDQEALTSGRSRLSELGIAVERPKPLVDDGITGAEGIGSEDTFDGDYGRLLDRAYERSVKVLGPQPDTL